MKKDQDIVLEKGLYYRTRGDTIVKCVCYNNDSAGWEVYDPSSGKTYVVDDDGVYEFESPLSLVAEVSASEILYALSCFLEAVEENNSKARIFTALLRY